MADGGGLLPPCRWWDAVSLGISRDVYHITAEGTATKLTGVVSLVMKAAGVAAAFLFLRERRRNSGLQAGGGGTTTGT